MKEQTHCFSLHSSVLNEEEERDSPYRSPEALLTDRRTIPEALLTDRRTINLHKHTLAVYSSQ